MRNWKSKGRYNICEMCGKRYFVFSPASGRTGKMRAKFCSNSCKGKSRYKQGIDNIIRKCEYCGKEFATNKYTKSRFCSQSCATNSTKPWLKNIGRKTGTYKYCKTCGKRFYVMPCSIKTTKYCSRACQFEGQIRKVELKCKWCGKKYYRPPSQIKWRGSSFCSYECQYRYAEKYTRGENSPNWQGGKSREYRRIRNSAKFRRWRIAVFERDDYTCQVCGDRSGNGKVVMLHPHHILSFTKYPKIRFEVDNGITLCKDCHYIIHNKDRYRVMKNTLENLRLIEEKLRA